MADVPSVSSFVVRVWREGAGSEDTRWRAQVDHVQSGRRRAFGDLNQILEFIHACLDSPPPDEPSPA
jgi:hypothetical protein